VFPLSVWDLSILLPSFAARKLPVWFPLTRLRDDVASPLRYANLLANPLEGYLEVLMGPHDPRGLRLV
jgi:hypothetical protein